MIRLPAEWEPQSFVQFTFPHQDSDWRESFEQVVPCFVEIIETVARFEPVLVICQNKEQTASYFSSLTNIHFTELPSNDTWARDHSGITILKDDQVEVLDFFFNGWGLKFPADQDNQITSRLFKLSAYGHAKYRIADLVLEGGAIESNGQGTLLTSSTCLLSPNRNPHLSKSEIEDQLLKLFGLRKILWLDHGHLVGDDTDAHIDTLARFCSADTIAYLQCTNRQDEHYEGLQKMELELKNLRDLQDQPYNLVPLPLPDPCYDALGDRLPATYANFLICNGAVLVPTYEKPQDQKALETLADVFPNRQIIGIDCLPLIEQHGSLHCITMQFPKPVTLRL